MRLRVDSDPAHAQEIKEFADWILDIGDGKVGGQNDGESVVKFPKEMLIPDSDNHVHAITQHIYPNLLPNLWNPKYFQERVIFAPTHDEVYKVNEHMLSMLDGEEHVYYSSDTVSVTDVDFNYDESLYTTKFLNSIRISGIPHHKLVLKVGTSVICLRNIDQRAGLCNGTRLQVLRMRTINIEGRIISGGKVGTICAIPRMLISLSDTKMPFKLNRRQYPISVCFAITINKSQSQTLSQVGLLLQRPVISHGQLYVAVSRVKSKRGLKVICCDRDGNYSDETTNVVYKEIIHRL
jgi:ATP-dependent DNA helicase PIF1